MNQDQNQNTYQNQSYPPDNTYGQMPGGGIGQVPGWNQPQGYPPGYGQSAYGGPQDGQGAGVFSIVSLVLGIMSIVLCCVYGGIFGIAGLVFGIISCVRHEAKHGMAIGGIITSAVGMVLFIFVIVFHFVMFQSITDYLLENYEAELNMGQEWYYAEPGDEDPFAGYRFVAGDDSVIYFENDGSFLWYQDDEEHEDNYYQGTYTTYCGETAIEVLIYEMTEYGVTQQEMDDYFARNADNHIYSEENFIVLTLRTEQAVIDGEEQERVPYERNYMGFFPEDYGYYDAVNMDSGEYVLFVITWR